MSNAKAADFGHRSERYGWPMTPRQLRRADHKIRRCHHPGIAPDWSFDGRTAAIGKPSHARRKEGQTPRRADAIAARRRAAEATR